MIGCSRPLVACFFLAAQLGMVKAEGQCIKPDNPQPLSESDLRTVVITKERNPGILDPDAFSLANTLDSIIKTAPRDQVSAPTAADREALLETLLETLRADTLSNDEAGITFNMAPLSDFEKITAKDLLDAQGKLGMQPVGLFNRLDLAPRTLVNCGEYRIVYAITKAGVLGDPNRDSRRFFINFEAALPNPTHDIVGCKQIAALWSSLKNLPDDQAKQTLLKFYYSGGQISPGGLSFEPVVHFRHFGSPSGQVRGNLTNATSLPWFLRQWNIKLSPVGIPTFDATPINKNPVPAYFGGRAVNAFPADEIARLQASFKNQFLCTNVAQLTSVDTKAANTSDNSVSEQELIAGISVDVETKFDAVQSVSGPAAGDSPMERAVTSGFNTQVAAQISKLKLDAACGLTAEHVLNRIGAMSCGGCHNFSNDREIAPGIRWPASLKFVQINEEGRLSDLLLNRFLPARAEITSKVASGNLPFAPSIASADVLRKLTTLREKLEPAEGDLQKSLSPEIETLSIDLRRSLAQEPGAFVMFRKPD